MLFTRNTLLMSAVAVCLGITYRYTPSLVVSLAIIPRLYRSFSRAEANADCTKVSYITAVSGPLFVLILILIVVIIIVHAKSQEDGAPYGHMICVSQPLAHMHPNRDIVIPVSGAQAARVCKGKIPTRRMPGNGGGEQGRGGAA